jgi:hypothetical protein
MSILPIVVAMFQISNPCAEDKDLIFLLCSEMGYQTECSTFSFPESWDCASEISEVCRDDLEAMDEYCEDKIGC